MDIDTAPLDGYGDELDGSQIYNEADGGVDGAGEDEEVEVEEVDGSQVPTRTQAKNFTQVEDVTLIKAWEVVSLDAVTGTDQTEKRY